MRQEYKLTDERFAEILGKYNCYDEKTQRLSDEFMNSLSDEEAEGFFHDLDLLWSLVRDI